MSFNAENPSAWHTWITGEICQLDIDTRRGRVRMSSGASEDVEFSPETIKYAKRAFCAGYIATFRALRVWQAEGTHAVTLVDSIESNDNS
jgi:hypothetical protein